MRQGLPSARSTRGVGSCYRQPRCAAGKSRLLPEALSGGCSRRKPHCWQLRASAGFGSPDKPRQACTSLTNRADMARPQAAGRPEGAGSTRGVCKRLFSYFCLSQIHRQSPKALLKCPKPGGLGHHSGTDPTGCRGWGRGQDGDRDGMGTDGEHPLVQEATSPPRLASRSRAQGSGGRALEEASSLLAGAGCFPSPAAGPFSFQSHLGWSGIYCRRHRSGAEGTVPG